MPLIFNNLQAYVKIRGFFMLIMHHVREEETGLPYPRIQHTDGNYPYHLTFIKLVFTTDYYSIFYR